MGFGRPLQSLWILVMGCNVVGNGTDEFLNRVEDSASDALVCDIPEPALDKIEP